MGRIKKTHVRVSIPLRKFLRNAEDPAVSRRPVGFHPSKEVFEVAYAISGPNLFSMFPSL